MKQLKLLRLESQLQNFTAQPLTSPSLLTGQVQNMFKRLQLWVKLSKDLTKEGRWLKPLWPSWLHQYYTHVVQDQSYWEVCCCFDANMRNKRGSKDSERRRF